MARHKPAAAKPGGSARVPGDVAAGLLRFPPQGWESEIDTLLRFATYRELRDGLASGRYVMLIDGEAGWITFTTKEDYESMPGHPFPVAECPTAGSHTPRAAPRPNFASQVGTQERGRGRKPR